MKMDYTVAPCYEGITVRDYLRSKIGLSRRILIRLKQTGGGICVNGTQKTVRCILRAGDVLSLALEDCAEDENPLAAPSGVPVDILYEDGELIAVDKPSGMVTHTSHGHHDDSLQNAVAGIFAKRGQPFVFRAINRLDRDTSGVVLIAKSQLTAYKMSLEMQSGGIHKVYRAVLAGRIEPPDGKIERYIRRRQESIIERIACAEGIPSEYALTEYKTLASRDEMSVVDARPITGRTHQLRVHFAYAGHPIIGDDLYGSADCRIKRQALHARSLTFTPPSGGEMTVTSPIPADIRSLCAGFANDEL